MCVFTAIGTAIATSVGMSVAAAGASAAGAAVISSTTAAVIGGVAVAGTVAGVAGTALGAIGSYQSGKAQAAAYDYQAKVARENQRIANNNAAMERQAGLEEAPRHGQPRHDDGHHAHQLDEDVEARAGGVLERVAYGVAYDSGFVYLAAFAAEVAFLDIFLGVVPCTAGVGHEYREHEAGRKSSDEQADHT